MNAIEAGVVFDDVVGRGGHSIPITVVVADLASPKDAGLKKTRARKRCIKQGNA